jgi:hypothetical protein
MWRVCQRSDQRLKADNPGNKCKFSHDRNIGRKVEKVNLYEDTREADKKADDMENWDEAKLRDVVNQNGRKQTNATDVRLTFHPVFSVVDGCSSSHPDCVQVLCPSNRREEIWLVVSRLFHFWICS